jgi:hypothetical protein
MSLLLLLAALPALYWPPPLDTAAALRQAGLDRVSVPPERVEAWRAAGFTAVAVGPEDMAARVKLHAPGIVGRIDEASATHRPWVFANGWRFLRRGSDRYLYELPAGKAALAAAEAFAYGADAVLIIDPADLEELGRMLAFLSGVPAAEPPGIADLAVVDDDSPLVGEVMNLLARRNLLFRVVRAPTRDLPVNVRLGTKEYPKKEARDPDRLALKVRRRLTDERRSLRLYGSEVVIARLTGDATRVRLHLLNYGGRTIEALRVRLRGSWAPGEAFVAGQGRMALEDYTLSESATEFSLALIETYAVVDLTAR